MNLRIQSAFALATFTTVMAACSSAPEDDASSTSSAIEGKFSFGPMCYDALQQQNIATALTYARTLAESGAFQSCLRDAMSKTISTGTDTIGPYHHCTDPAGSAPASALNDPTYADMAGNVIGFLRGKNPITVDCPHFADGNTVGEVSSVGDIGSTATEYIALDWNFAKFLNAQSLTSVIMHEESHLHGYHHGPGTGTNAATAEGCGTHVSPGESDYLWAKHHTVPYIVEACADLVLLHSAQACGNNFATACGAHQLRLVTGYATTRATTSYACTCVRDPSYPACSGRGCEVEIFTLP